MPAQFNSPTRRRFLTASATAGAFGFAAQTSAEAFDLVAEAPAGSGSSAGDAAAVRPFRVSFPASPRGCSTTMRAARR